MIMTAGDNIDVSDLPEIVRSPVSIGRAGPSTDAEATRVGTLREFKDSTERECLVTKLRENGWNISKTAEAIDTPRSNLYKKLETCRSRRRPTARRIPSCLRDETHGLGRS